MKPVKRIDNVKREHHKSITNHYKVWYHCIWNPSLWTWTPMYKTHKRINMQVLGQILSSYKMLCSIDFGVMLIYTCQELLIV